MEDGYRLMQEGVGVSLRKYESGAKCYLWTSRVTKIAGLWMSLIVQDSKEQSRAMSFTNSSQQC